jgi:DNA-binding XRE family transcriptional regulator
MPGGVKHGGILPVSRTGFAFVSRKATQASRALGKAFSAARAERGYTQESFALKAGIDRSYYGALERGEYNMTIETIMTVATGLGIPAWELWKRAGL